MQVEKVKVPTPQQLFNAKKTADEEIAEAVKSVSDGTKRLMGGRLNKKAILLLLSHASGCTQSQVSSVLDAMQSLEKRYLK